MYLEIHNEMVLSVHSVYIDYLFGNTSLGSVKVKVNS